MEKNSKKNKVFIEINNENDMIFYTFGMLSGVVALELENIIFDLISVITGTTPHLIVQFIYSLVLVLIFLKIGALIKIKINKLNEEKILRYMRKENHYTETKYNDDEEENIQIEEEDEIPF